jgi:YidC/Oxa1 family membrane protein insertase
VDRNTFLAFALSFLVVSLWVAFEADRRPRPVPQRTAPVPEGQPSAVSTAEAPPAPAQLPAVPEKPSEPERRIPIENELFRAELSSHGAGLVRWELQGYFASSQEGGDPVELTAWQPEQTVALATPMQGLGLGDLSQAAFSVTEASPNRVTFEYSAAGLTVRKVYRFERDSYLFRLGIEVVNQTSGSVAPEFVLRWPARLRKGADFSDTMLAVLHDGDLERVPLSGFGTGGLGSSLFGSTPERTKHFDGEVDWAGVQTRYFLAVVLPDVPRDTQVRLSAEEPGAEALAELALRPFSLPAGRAVEREFRVYVGPKEPERLAAIGAHLDRSIDVGWAWIAPLTRGFNWLLRACYSVIPNYGVAIILITLLVRLVTAPLATKQMRSMKRLGELQPKVRALQEKHGDDRQRQSQEMMKLYRESGVNPLGGCLPMLLQVPVFIALYYALQSSIDLRQAPFVAWIQDLSQPETIFSLPGLGIPVRLLPLLMGVSMIAQQKLTPTTMDPSQARMMMTVMPVMFTVLFYTFPSGLVLYWLVSNLLAIGQQLLMNRGTSSTKA